MIRRLPALAKIRWAADLKGRVLYPTPFRSASRNRLGHLFALANKSLAFQIKALLDWRQEGFLVREEGDSTTPRQLRALPPSKVKCVSTSFATSHFLDFKKECKK